MKKYFLLLITTVYLTFAANAQIVLKKIKILDNQIEIAVPTDFVQMPEQMIVAKFPKKPDWVITDKDEKIMISCTYTGTTMDDNNIPGYTDQLLTELKVDKKNIEFTDDGILLQDGKNIGYVEFISTVKSQKVFNYIFYLSLHDRLLIFTFNCPNKWKGKWELTAEEIASSIRVIN